MSTPFSLSRRNLRELLIKIFLRDADFEAFCIDYFPDIKRLFADGMDRTTRINLMLELAKPEQLTAALYNRSPDASVEWKRLFPETDYNDLARIRNDTLLSERSEISEKLAALYTERETLIELERITTDVDNAILELRRQLRQGPQLQAGEFLSDGRYRLLARVGRGGFANVWLALDRYGQKPTRVAIKVLHSDLAEDRTIVERFYRGARHMAALSHPHVAKVVELGREDQGFHFFVMEYLNGGDLEHAVLEGKLSPEKALHAVIQAGSALHYAHTKGIVHRDVKPGNILLDENGSAQLTDFDLVLARDTTGGTRTGALGTFLYSAPEELEDARNADARSDIYSMGMMLAFVISRRRLPQQAITNQKIFLAQLSCGKAMKLIIQRAISVDPQVRFSSIDELCKRAALAALGLNSKNRSLPLFTNIRRNRSWIALAILIILVAIYNVSKERQSSIINSALNNDLAVSEFSAKTSIPSSVVAATKSSTDEPPKHLKSAARKLIGPARAKGRTTVETSSESAEQAKPPTFTTSSESVHLQNANEVSDEKEPSKPKRDQVKAKIKITEEDLAVH